MNIENIWETALDHIRKNIDSEAGYKAYMQKVKPIAYDENSGIVSLGVTLPLEKCIIELRYLQAIENALTLSVGKTVKANITIISDTKKSVKTVRSGEPKKKLPVENKTIDPRFTFDNFVVGSTNQFAYTVSKKVAENPGFEHNPLFLYGKSGVGKTHLMHAIGNHALKYDPSLVIIYITSETFLNDFIACVRDKTMDEFRHKYRNVDLLLVDDIQLFEGKGQSLLEEFFHTFNELHSRGNQIILTSDRMPQDLVNIEERLRSRFGGGLTVDIQMPDYETRIAILKKKAEGHDINDEVYTYIADRVKSNVRELKSALDRVISFANMKQKPINLDITKEALNNILPSDNVIKVTSSKVLECVSEYYGISPDKIKGKERTKNIAYARQMAQYLCFNIVGMNYTSIGKEFGNCDHTTVMSNVKKIKKYINENEKTKNEIEQIKKNLQSF